MLGIEVQLVLCLVQLRCQLFQMLTELPLKLEHAPYWFGFLLCTRRVEPGTASKHGFLDLTSDHRSNLSEVLSYSFYFEGGTHQKFQVGFELTDFSGHARRIEAAADKVEDVDLLSFLAVAIHTTIALLHP